MQRGLQQRHSRNPQISRPLQHNTAVAVAVAVAAEVDFTAGNPKPCITRHTLHDARLQR